MPSDIIVVERELLKSKAFRSLGGNAKTVYFDFLMKCKIGKTKARPGHRSQKVILNNGQIEYCYSEAEKKGIIIADTKMEFGLYQDKLILIDELLTPDSSRFWPLDKYKPGLNPPSFDKQYVRDYLTSIEWNKKPPAPKLDLEIIKETSTKYIEAYERLTGRRF